MELFEQLSINVDALSCTPTASHEYDLEHACQHIGRRKRQKFLTEIVEVSSPFVVRCMIGKDRFEDKLLSLTIEIVMKVIP